VAKDYVLCVAYILVQDICGINDYRSLILYVMSAIS